MVWRYISQHTSSCVKHSQCHGNGRLALYLDGSVPSAGYSRPMTALQTDRRVGNTPSPLTAAASKVSFRLRLR